MPQGKKTLTEEVKMLKAENRRLKKQLASVSTKQSGNIWRTTAIVILAGMAGAILISANLLFWTARTIVETDKYHDTARAIIKEPSVQKAIADKATDAIFTQVDTEQLLVETLPPRVQFAAPTLAKQIETFTNNKARQVTATKKFQNVWVDVNTRAHDRFISVIKQSKSDGTINISDVYARLTQRLEGTKLSFVQNVKLPSNIGSIQVLDAPWLPSARYVVINLDMLRIATISLFVILSGLIVYIAKSRRKIVLKISVFYAVLMLITLVSVRISRAILVGQVPTPYQQAATDAYQAVLQPFVMQSSSLLSLAVVVALAAWIVGPSKVATKVRVSFNTLLQGKAHQALFGAKENTYTKWVGKYQTQLQWLAVVLAVISLLIVSVTIVNILWVVVILLVTIGIIQISATKK